VGTYLEHKFEAYLVSKYDYEIGSSAKGIDFPGLNVDMKTTSIAQPQSSCPYKSARQKIYGLGYSILIFVYDKADNHKDRTGCLRIKHAIFIDKSRTADFQTTTGIQMILENNGNIDDIKAFFEERHLPVDDITANALAEEVLSNPPETGYLTISKEYRKPFNYERVIPNAGKVAGIMSLKF
ncbi:MAG: restriction endonuclease, partial [bacterium]